MPLNRYQIRNEYSLADPQLYRDTDKDDPEALLEGVAMAGLVGVLRQLGDLAESIMGSIRKMFAAEIFHDLHEDMMVTASRGQDLITRIQQLEAEVPFIEKTFLLQTDHSSFSYNPGVDWHPNLRRDQKLVTQSDFPRFVMDSYEECRGPPRLFLLDKFDVGGAGACLKRFTDPSFFKVETSARSSADVQAENKIQKAMKKEQCLRNEGTTKGLKHSGAKLHQLFLKESVLVGNNGPAPMKLKRRLSWFLFDSKPRKSYMEKLFKTPSSEHEMLHGISGSLPLPLPTNSHNECDPDVLEMTSPDPARKGVERERSPPHPDGEGILLNEVIQDKHDVSTDKIYEERVSCVDFVSHGLMSTFYDKTSEVDIHVDEIDIHVDGERKPESSSIYLADEIAGETDNFVDAPSSMEPEVETDPELRLRNDEAFSSPQSSSLISVETDKHLYSQTSDSQTAGGSIISNCSSNPTRNELSSSISPDSQVSSSEDPLSESNIEYFLEIVHEDRSVDRMLNPVVSDIKHSIDVALDNKRHDLEQLPSNLWSNDSLPSLPHSDTEEVANKSQLRECMSPETASTSDYEEKETNLIVDFPWSPSVADCKLQPRADHLGSSSGEYLVDDPGGANATSMPTFPEIICDGIDTSAAAITSCLLREDNCDQEDLNYSKSTISSINLCDVRPQNRVDTAETIPCNTPIRGVFSDDACEYPESIPCDNTEIGHSGDDKTLVLSKGEKQEFELADEGINAISDTPNCFRSIMEASVGQDPVESHLAYVEIVGNLDQCCNSSLDEQISSEKLNLLVEENCPYRPEADINAQDVDAIPKEGTTLHEPYELGFPSISGGSGWQSSGVSDVFVSNDSMDYERSYCTPRNLEEPAGVSGIPKNGSIQARVESGWEGSEISSRGDFKFLNEVHLELDVSDSNKNETTTSSMPTVSVYDVEENISLVMVLPQSVEEHIPCFADSGLDEHVKDNDDSSRSHGESRIAEEVGERADAISDVAGTLCSVIDCNHTKLDLSSIVNPDLGSIVEHGPVDVVLSQSTPRSSLDVGQDSFPHSSVEKQVYDATLFHDTAGMVLRERKISELPPILPIDHLQNNDDFKQQILEFEEKEVENFSASLFSVINRPTSAAELPGLRNSDNEVSGYPEDPYRFTSPKTSFLSQTNQIILDEKPPLPPLPPFKWRIGKLQHSSETVSELVNQKESLPPEMGTPISSYNVNSLVKEMNNPLTLYVPGTTSKEDKPEQISSVVEVNLIQETTFLQTKMETMEQHLVRPVSKSEVINSTAEEDGVVNSSLKGKFSRLPNPLIDSVDALDKSKLRKVSEQVKPQQQKVDERDSFLEQIRSKSFNLKPAVGSRPSIQGPKTNLKVAAILEKANAIRQALAGSDEDDEENWSDS